MLCTHSKAEAHMLINMASPLQSHKVTLQRKLQERQGDLQSKQQLLAAVEKVGACSALVDAHSSRSRHCDRTACSLWPQHLMTIVTFWL